MRLGALQERHRERVREILDATAVFRPDEVAVALELFDDGLRIADCGPADCGLRIADRGSSDEDADRTSTSDYEFLGAFDESESLVGYACYGATPGTDRTYDLYWIATHPTAQGRGVGSRLLSEVEQRLHDRGARMLVVETSSRSTYEATRRFYDVRGFDETARLQDFYAPADDRVIYTKRLDRVADCGLRIAN